MCPVLQVLRKRSRTVAITDVFRRESAASEQSVLPALLFGAIFGIINSKNELINRLLWYYLGIYVLCIPSVLSKYKKFERLILTVGVVAVLLTYSIISLRENQNGVVPYSFFW